MNCPFCGTELYTNDIEFYCCPTAHCALWECEGVPEKVIKALIDGKKAQEVLKKIANHDINEQRGEPKSYVIGYEEIKEMAITSLTKS